MERLRSASLITAVKTPYQPDGSIDLDAYDALLSAQAKHGVDGVIVGGTTGEGHLILFDQGTSSWEEKIFRDEARFAGMIIQHIIGQWFSDLFGFIFSAMQPDLSLFRILHR